MRHGKTGRRLGRSVSHRKALFANLSGSLCDTRANGSITLPTDFDIFSPRLNTKP